MSSTAVPWSSHGDYYIALECKDLQANAMAIDSTGTYVLLAGRRHLTIRNLDDDDQILHKFQRQSKYDVGAAEWNPTPFNKQLCVIASNQRLEVLTWRTEELTQTHSLRAHTRVITDLNWHKFDPNILASCSVDTFIHLWDIRDPRKPTLSLSAIAEASQVRWNRLSQHLLATAHEGDIKIWDQRKGTAPIQYIAAHVSKIHGLDWSYKNENFICSSSQDCTVKFFDISNPRRSELVITTNAPVWRARHMPFGKGLVTAVVPQLRRGENGLLLWDITNKATPIYTFSGHRDVVLEFEWRKQKNDNDFQLISWSRDQTLLVWRIDGEIQKLVGYEPKIDTFETDQIKILPKIQPLQQEFSLLNTHIPNLVVKNMNFVTRQVLVKASVNAYVVWLKVTFPDAYPHGVTPNFEIVNNSNLSESVSVKLLQILKRLAQQRVSKNRTCLEPCLRQMVSMLEQWSNEKGVEYDRNFLETSYLSGYNDNYIPFPKMCGAKFCSVSTLVCFDRPMLTRRVNQTSKSNARNVSTLTPRALSALDKTYPTISATYYYFQKRLNTSRVKANNASPCVVHIYDALGLFFVNRQLGEEYILNGDVGTICKHNAAVAALVGRWDLVQAWTLAELVAGPQQADEEMSWAVHPFGNKLMQSLIAHYASQFDLQMAAMLCCIFGKDHEMSIRKTSEKTILSGPGGSPYHTIPPADVIADDWMLPMLKTTRSTSLDNLRVEELIQAKPPQKSSTALYVYYKQAYAETLHRWGLIYNRTEVMKHVGNYSNEQISNGKGVEFMTDCERCSKPAKSSTCNSCRKLTLKCAVCHISVRGSANCCINCGHGGHMRCLKWWFSFRNICLTGCGCRCLEETAAILNL